PRTAQKSRFTSTPTAKPSSKRWHRWPFRTCARRRWCALPTRCRWSTWKCPKPTWTWSNNVLIWKDWKGRARCGLMRRKICRRSRQNKAAQAGTLPAQFQGQRHAVPPSLRISFGNRFHGIFQDAFVGFSASLVGCRFPITAKLCGKSAELDEVVSSPHREGVAEGDRG